MLVEGPSLASRFVSRGEREGEREENERRYAGVGAIEVVLPVYLAFLHRPRFPLVE